MKKLVNLPVFATLMLVGFGAAGIVEANQQQLSNVQNLVRNLTAIANTVIGLLAVVAIIVFIWGIIKYVLAEGDAEKRADARGFMIYGVVGIAVLVGIWALVNFLLNFFGLNGTQTVNLPTVGQTNIQ
jgi:hypothetical protein